MYDHEAAGGAGARPRVVIVGRPRGTFSPELRSLLAPVALTREIDGPLPLLGWPRALQSVSRAVHDEGFEIVHLAAVRYAQFGRFVGRRLGVPVTVDVTPEDLQWGRGRRRLPVDVIDSLDEVFAAGPDTAEQLRRVTRIVPITPLPLHACGRAEPSRAALRRLTRALRRAEPSGVVVALPWTHEMRQLRWFRDALLPALGGNVTCLMAGVPDRATLQRTRQIIGRRSDVVLLRGKLDAEGVSAIARSADVVMLPWHHAPEGPDADAMLQLAFVGSGTPVIARETDEGRGVLEHERSAFMVRAGEAFGFASTLTQLLVLPALQRHYVGAEFAAYAMEQWPADALAAVYAERFAALAGRPQIPAELRAA